MKPVFSSFATKSIEKSLWKSFPKPVDTFLDSSRQLILRGANQVIPGQVLALGAGECYEIPVADLANRFATVNLQDVNTGVLQAASNQFDFSALQRGRIQMIVSDLNGFTNENGMFQILQGLEDLPDAGNAAKLVTDRLQRLSPKLFILPTKSNFVIASCVLSQLHISFFRTIIDGFKKHFPHDIDALIEEADWIDVSFKLSEKLERNFIRALRENVVESGLVYLSATIHLLQYQFTDLGDWQSTGMQRACRFASINEYVYDQFRIEHKEEFWWDITPTCKPGEIGHGYRVEAVILSPL